MSPYQLRCGPRGTWEALGLIHPLDRVASTARTRTGKLGSLPSALLPPAASPIKCGELARGTGLAIGLVQAFTYYRGYGPEPCDGVSSSPLVTETGHCSLVHGDHRRYCGKR